jgi:hypothetical protein
MALTTSYVIQIGSPPPIMWTGAFTILRLNSTIDACPSIGIIAADLLTNHGADKVQVIDNLMGTVLLQIDRAG